jgi:hypothetical protein
MPWVSKPFAGTGRERTKWRVKRKDSQKERMKYKRHEDKATETEDKGKRKNVNSQK